MSVPLIGLQTGVEADNQLKLVYDEFVNMFQKQPDFLARVPGRVNLIGEHVDYCGYGVCPMALKQNVTLAVSRELDHNLMLLNTDFERYPSYETLLADITLPLDGTGEQAGGPQWYAYFLCGVKGILDKHSTNITTKCGMKVLIKGSIPPCAGLSSSSALVSAAALATAHCFNLSLDKMELADVSTKCERYIGTQSGGMDQAIAFLAEEGCAKYIEFNPLRCSNLSLPPNAVFVIAHSTATLNKAATADYNCRVAECRLAAQMIAATQKLDWTAIQTLAEIQKALNTDLASVMLLVQEKLHKSCYSKQEIAAALQTTVEHVDSISLAPNVRHIQSFQLRQRAMHVFGEALRVQKFVERCGSTGGTTTTDSGTLEAIGQLMNESHVSLRYFYECSHPNVDKLVELSAKYSLGCRLTGAGWGGCVVALVLPHHVQTFMSHLSECFYQPMGIEDAQNDGLMFATIPHSGATIYQ